MQSAGLAGLSVGQLQVLIAGQDAGGGGGGLARSASTSAVMQPQLNPQLNARLAAALQAQVSIALSTTCCHTRVSYGNLQQHSQCTAGHMDRIWTAPWLHPPPFPRLCVLQGAAAQLAGRLGPKDSRRSEDASGSFGSSGGGGGGGRFARRGSESAASERRSAQERLYSLDLDRVLAGEDSRLMNHLLHCGHTWTPSVSVCDCLPDKPKACTDMSAARSHHSVL